MEQDKSGSEEPKAPESVQADKSVLDGLKLSEQEMEMLKANENLLGLVTHLTEAKRTANDEAKKYRTEFEKYQDEKKKAEEEALKQQGEYQKLYEEAQQNLSIKDEAIKKAVVNGELQRLAGMHGLAKADYLKLLDTSSIEVDMETLSVKGAEEMFKSFKEENPNLFTGAKVANTDSSQPRTTNKTDKLSIYQEFKKKPNKSKDEVARLFSMERDLKKEGLI